MKGKKVVTLEAPAGRWVRLPNGRYEFEVSEKGKALLSMGEDDNRGMTLPEFRQALIDTRDAILNAWALGFNFVDISGFHFRSECKREIESRLAACRALKCQGGWKVDPDFDLRKFEKWG